MNNEALDFLPGTNFEIYQKDEMYHFNTDSVLLGKFIDIKHKDRVLDIGCNNGVLMLYAARFSPKELCGIDLFEEVIEVAKENLNRYQIPAQFSCASIEKYDNGKFDKLICNPPYFTTKNRELQNQNRYICAARHESSLTLDVLFQNSRRLMKDTASLYLVHRASRFSEIIEVARKYHLKAKRVQLCYPSHSQNAKSVLIEFKIGKTGEISFLPACFINEL